MNIIDIKPDGFVNTHEFSKEARHFLKHGYYTNAPKGTGYFREYWDEQTKRCLEGYEVGGINITGPHYFYLNFTRIEATVKINGIPTTRVTFPRFLDIDYYYYHELEKARAEGQGIIVAKARRKGFSYKNSSLCTHRMNFMRESRTFIGAFLKDFAENTMGMAYDSMNFLNKHTAWYKNLQPNRRNEEMHARFEEVIDGRKVWSGYDSNVSVLTFKDNFSAAIGKKAELFLFEEAGKWPNLIKSYMITSPVFRDGNIMIGMPIIFGTGGDMDGGSNDFAEMFYNPKDYFLRPFENVWDEGAFGTECGIFIDDMWYKPGEVTMPKFNEEKGEEEMTTVEMVDEDGNSNREAAEYFLDQEREVIKGSKSRSTWEKHITQYCKTPREAFLRTSGNIFPTIELNKWLAQIETNKYADSLGIPGNLYWENEKVKFEPDYDLRPIEEFPIKQEDDKEGCVVIYESPFKDDMGEIPFGLYIAGTDPYDQDDAEHSASLGSTIVYKTFQRFDKTYNFPVAEYTGRPDSAKDYYETVRKLLTYYNAKTLYENNLKGLKIYFEQKKSLHLLKEQPSILKDIVPNSKVHRGYGIHMSDPIKIQGELYLRDWLLEQRGDGEDGETKKLNLHTIYSKALLKELISYTKDGNFDRVIAFMLCILHSQENYKIQVEDSFDKESKFHNSFFNRPLFQKNRAKKQRVL